MLQSTDPMRRSSAAMVLAELAPRSKEVVEQLGQALEGAGDALAGHLLDALQATGARAAIPYAMPFLRADDLALRVRAVAIVASGGAAVVPEIKRHLKDASRQDKLVYVDLLARVFDPQTYGLLLEWLVDADTDLSRAICEAAQRHVKNASPAERLVLHKCVAGFMKSPAAKQHDRVLVSCLLLLGHIGRKEAAAVLLKHSAAQTPSAKPVKVHLRSDPNYIRRHALIGLKGVECTGKAIDTVLSNVLPCLDDDDEQIARLATEIVGRFPPKRMTAARWKKLLQNRHAPVRVFAARMLAEHESPESSKLLVDLLGTEDNAVRETAASALAHRVKAVPALLDALAASKDVECAWQLAKVLKPHSEAVKKADVARFKTLVARELLARKPRAEALLYFLRNIDPGMVESLLLDAGLKHKRAKRWPEAIDCLRRLIHSELFDTGVSYALSVCDLKASHKELDPHLRADDHALRGFQSLARRGATDLLKRLTGDKTLDAADLFYVGVHFSEGSPEFTELGNELLRLVVTRWPRSTEAKAARKRLGSRKTTAS